MERNQQRFSPAEHVPKYTRHLFVTLRTPLLVYFALIGNLILGSLMAAFYFFEKNSNPDVNNLFDAFWWGLVTVTTVGYGDTIPVTLQGKLIAMVLMVSGVIFFVAFTALLVSFLLAHSGETGEQRILSELQALREEISKLKKSSD